MAVGKADAGVRIARVALALTLALLAGTASAVQPAPSRSQDDTGVLCVLAILSMLDHIGGQCFPGQDSEFQGEVRGSLDRLGKHVMTRSNMTPGDFEAFKDEQSLRAMPRDLVCQGTPTEFYAAFRDRREELRGMVEQAIAKPGPPGWNTCF